MKAVVFHGPHDLRLDELPMPQPGPGGAPAGRPEDAVLAAAETSPLDLRNRRIQSWGFPREHSRTICHRSLQA